MNPEEWLLFTVGRVIKDLKLPGPGVTPHDIRGEETTKQYLSYK